MTTGTYPRQSQMRSLIISLALTALLTTVIAAGLLALYSVGTAHADSGSGSGSGSGSAIDVVSAPALGVVDELKELRAKYEVIKAQGDKDAKLLLWAGLIAGMLKLLLTIVHRVSGPKPKRWMAWIAMGLAVPIALLSHYALGNSVFDSLVVAGGGPGAVLVHELLQAFKKREPAPST